MTALIETGQHTSPTYDCTPMLFAAMADDSSVWLRRIFTATPGLTPVLIACQQMAGHVDIVEPPVDFTSEFHVVRLGDTTFDLEVHLLGVDGRILARSTSVISVVSSSSGQSTPIPPWLSRTLRKKGSHG